MTSTRIGINTCSSEMGNQVDFAKSTLKSEINL